MTTSPASVTLFAMRYRNTISAPDAWLNIDARDFVPVQDRNTSERVTFAGMPTDVTLYESAKYVAAGCTKAKATHGNAYIFAVNKVVISDPEQVAALVARHTWKEREQARFDDGTYNRTIFEGLDWFDALSPDLFIHNAAGKAGYISLTESAHDGQRDRQTRMTVSRFLARYYQSASEERRSELCGMWREHFGLLPDLRFTSDPAKIEKVYTSGPGACMSYPTEHFSTRDSEGTRHHPTAVYGDGPDLKLAYLLDPDTLDSDTPRIVARVLCWPEKLSYGRSYGDTYAIEALLKAQGYKRKGLVGAKIRNIPLPHGDFVMPYIDDTQCAQTHCDHWHLIADDGEGDLYAGNTNGLSNAHEPRADCDHCGDTREEGDLNSVHVDGGTQDWCSYCRESDAIWCREDREYYSGEDFTTLDSGGMAPNDEVGECEHTGQTCHQDDLVELSDGRMVQSHLEYDLQTEIDDAEAEAAEAEQLDLLDSAAA